MEGWRSPGEEQCDMHINCCNANGPRGFALIPQAMYHVSADRIQVNLYAPSETSLTLPGKKGAKVSLRQVTEYPVDGQIAIEVNPKKPARFQMALRIPAWCSLQHVKLAVNGEAVYVNATGWQVIEREWQADDRITLELDMRARLVELNQHQAILRGPVLFARDSRFGDGDVDETSVVQAKEGYVEITPAEVPDYAWMSFTAP